MVSSGKIAGAALRSRIFLVAAICTGLVPMAAAQAVSPTLVPPLNSEGDIAPVTTLAIDLLAPEHAFAFDPTGASVLSGALNPASNASALSAAPTQIDTALRNSTQTGHTSPFATAGSASMLSAFDGAKPGNSGSAPPSSGDNSESDLHSSWGKSSPSSSSSSGSSWGGKSSQTSTRDQSPTPDGNSSPDNRLVQSSPSPRTRRSGSLASSASALQTASPTGSDTRNRNRGASSGDRSAMPGMTQTMPQSGDGESNGENPLLYSPEEYRGYSFGQSPFSSPAASGELTFLQPNILSPGLPQDYASRRSSRIRQNPLAQEPGLSDRLAASSSRYGLESHFHQDMLRHPSESSLGSHRKGARKNPYLTGSDIGVNSL